MDNAAIADRTWISRVSNLAWRIAEYYPAALACSIIAVVVSAVIWSGAAFADPARRFCVLVPHFKDEYWLSVGYGLEQEAARKNVALLIHEAGGYRALAAQISQIDACAISGVDAILIGAVSSDDPALIAAIARVAQTVPVFALVNELHSDALSGQIGVDWQDMGHAIGLHLARLHPPGTPPVTAVFITGPPTAGWTRPLEAGLRDGLADSAVSITAVLGADTGLRQQLELVETALRLYPDADYLIGGAPAIEAAVGVLAANSARPSLQLISTYISHSTLRSLRNGNVVAAAFDDPMRQGIMAIQQAVSAQTPRVNGPEIRILNQMDDVLDQIRLSPADYFPTLP